VSKTIESWDCRPELACSHVSTGAEKFAVGGDYSNGCWTGNALRAAVSLSTRMENQRPGAAVEWNCYIAFAAHGTMDHGMDGFLVITPDFEAVGAPAFPLIMWVQVFGCLARALLRMYLILRIILWQVFVATGNGRL